MIIYATNGQEILVDDNIDTCFLLKKWYITVKRGTPYVYKKSRDNDSKKSKSVYLHRLLIKADKGEFVDHINGNTLDNRLSNLRKCTNSQNLCNQRLRKNRINKYKGVYDTKRKLKKPFTAQITLNQNIYRLGYFSSAKEAALAYNEAALKYHGQYARLNEVPK